jgi:hypothetical protein
LRNDIQCHDISNRSPSILVPQQIDLVRHFGENRRSRTWTSSWDRGACE